MTQDWSLLLLEVVKVKPRACQLGCSSNKSHQDCNWFQRRQALDGVLSKAQRTTSLHSQQPDSALSPGHKPMGRQVRDLSSEHLTQGCQRMNPLKILTPEKRQITNRWRESQTWSPNEASAHAGRGPALLGELDRRSSRPRWLRRSPGGTSARRTLHLRSGTACEPTAIPRVKQPKCLGQVKHHISLGLITYKAFRTCSFQILYADGV